MFHCTSGNREQKKRRSESGQRAPAHIDASSASCQKAPPSMGAALSAEICLEIQGGHVAPPQQAEIEAN